MNAYIQLDNGTREYINLDDGVSILAVRNALSEISPSVYSVGRDWVLTDSQLQQFANIILRERKQNEQR